MKSSCVCVLVILFSPIQLRAQNPVAELKGALENFKTAMAAQDGTRSSMFVDRKTRDYYGRILYVVKKADSARLFTLPLMEILAVAYVRHTYSRETILSLDTTKLMQAELTDGLIKKIGVQSLNIESAIMPSGSTTASARVTQQIADWLRRRKSFYMDFTREDGIWKVNVPSLLKIVGEVLVETGQPKMLGDAVFVKLTLEKATNQPVSNAVWHPVK